MRAGCRHRRGALLSKIKIALLSKIVLDGGPRRWERACCQRAACSAFQRGLCVKVHYSLICISVACVLWPKDMKHLPVSRSWWQGTALRSAEKATTTARAVVEMIYLSMMTAAVEAIVSYLPCRTLRYRKRSSHTILRKNLRYKAPRGSVSCG